MAVLYQYHPSLRQLLDYPPNQGDGHNWLFRTALHLGRYHTPEAVARFLIAYTRKWDDRTVPEKEVANAVQNAFASAMTPGEFADYAPDWPAWDAGTTMTRSLVEPLPVQDLEVPTSRILPALFSPDDWVCLGYDQTLGGTRRLRDVLAHGGYADAQFIVPSPMTGPTGIARDGSHSYRCLGNTGRRRYLVIESDCLDRTEQLRVIAHLAQCQTQARLAMVVDSGGKSYHAWFDVREIQDRHIRSFFAYAARLGADTATWIACQWVRLPGGTRKAQNGDKRSQAIMWLPKATIEELFG